MREHVDATVAGKQPCPVQQRDTLHRAQATGERSEGLGEDIEQRAPLRSLRTGGIRAGEQRPIDAFAVGQAVQLVDDETLDVDGLEIVVVEQPPPRADDVARGREQDQRPAVAPGRRQHPVEVARLQAAGVRRGHCPAGGAARQRGAAEQPRDTARQGGWEEDAAAGPVRIGAPGQVDPRLVEQRVQAPGVVGQRLGQRVTRGDPVADLRGRQLAGPK